MHKNFDFNTRPLLVFWETTQACKLACRHCRAAAMERRDPLELSLADGFALIDSIKAFGNPTPMLILTGGDLLMRPDLGAIISYARDQGVRTAVSPSVTPLLTRQRLEEFVDMGIMGISLSLDGATAEVHDGIRGVPGTFDATLDRIRDAVDLGMRVQVNTAVMRSTVNDLPRTFHLIKSLGIRIWEVFFLIHTGRGAEMEDIEPWEYEEVAHFLYDASCYGMLVRTTEAPLFRRVIQQRRAPGVAPVRGALLDSLRRELRELEGDPEPTSSARTIATGDGRGIVFVNHRGDVYPSGYLTLAAGNVRNEGLLQIYKDSELFTTLRSQDKLGGKCGRCDYRTLCGGSRARAHATFGTPYAEDPACIYQPPQPPL